jgi:farnesyl diphosphate synthase
LVGDGLQALAIEVLLSGLGPLLPAHQVVTVTKELVAASGISGMVSGQSLDLSELNKKILTEEELETIHQLKTGKLILACFSMVLATQESSAHDIQNALMIYAQHVGLVFQIQDDYLDHYAPQNHLGKNRCSDLANEKTTFATLFTKNQLEEKINYHYEQAFECLKLFGTKAIPLIELTQQLHKRSQF